jgi:ArsR family transcriptional regulator
MQFLSLSCQNSIILIKISGNRVFSFSGLDFLSKVISTVGGYVEDFSAIKKAGDLSDLNDSAESASELLKTLSHSGRLMILCNLADGEKSVSELEDMLGTRQAAVSQQLARLRKDKLVRFRREGKTVYYSLADSKARRVIELLYSLYCR